ncbi:MAG: glycoside hydrolase family 2 TIM barrel-domain containing protein [Acutalibacteraceae bacterium]
MFAHYHKSLEHLHVGCEDPCAYYIPYADRESALAGERSNSVFFRSLCGEWDFRFYDCFEDAAEVFPQGSTDRKMPVPYCWQVSGQDGLDVPVYSNLKYPFPLDPPHVPLENPCGHYRRTVTLDKAFLDGEVYIRFEGVSSCFYLCVNGTFAGYSQVSHCISDFNITALLHEGENTVDVLVVKWSTGSYLEDQDYFRLSGIFREVYLLHRSENHLKDIYIRQSVREDLQSAVLTMETDAVGTCILLDESGKTVAQGSLSEPLTVDNPTLWNCEVPTTYTLLVQCAGEVIPFQIALRRIDVKDAVIYLNGVKVKAYGINRHDSNPETGYAVSVEDMRRDLVLLKQASCNCIRTSHYPNDPRFLDMAEKMGFMLVDEADLETHGMGFEYRDTWDWPRWSMLSNGDAWTESYVDRARRLFERDKNHGCVVLWSLGNESGCGRNHRAMRQYIKSRDPEALVHYENAHLEFKAVPVGECFVDISDVESRMYSSLEYTEEYLQNRPKKPFFFCEYVCSMTTGDIHAHIDLVDKYDALFGACVWEFCDHAVAVKKPDGTKAYRIGGDFGYGTGDTVGCIDGMVFPDRTPRPGYFDMKQAYVPFSVRLEDGDLFVYNRRFFTDLSDTQITWKLTCDGKTVQTGTLPTLSIAPRTEQKMAFSMPSLPQGECFLTFFIATAEETDWAEKGFLLGFAQLQLSEAVQKTYAKTAAPQVKKQGRMLTVESGSTVYQFDTVFGRVEQILCGGEEMLSKPSHIEFWKAHPYNQGGTAEERRSASMEQIIQQTYSTEVQEAPDAVQVICRVSFGGASVEPVMHGTLTFTFTGDGALTVHLTAQKREIAPKLARLALAFTMKPQFEQMSYYGAGPLEAYPDRHKACYIDAFETTVTENFVHYIRPFENGAHWGTRTAAVTDEKGAGLRFCAEKPFIFGATHCTPYLLESTAHDDELVPDADTHVYLDAGMDIAGQQSAYCTALEPERVWDDTHIDFAVRIEPAKSL